jgi:hypothetical protein
MVINFNGKAALLKQKPSLGACESQINTDPIYGPDNSGYVDFSNLSDGMQFCLLGVNNLVIYVKLMAVSDVSYTTTWSATGWALPSGN